MLIFIIIGLTIYSLPNIYVYFRIKSLVSNDRHKKIFSVFYPLFALSFPLTEVLSHNTDFAWVKYFLVISYYSLAFLLYLFLSLVLFDILRGVNRLLKIIPLEVIQSRKFRMISLSILFALPTAIVIIGSVNYYHIRINHYHIDVPRKSSQLKHLKIAMAADFHLRELTSKRFIKEFVEKINSIEPDILLIPGDVIEGDRQNAEMIEFESQFRKIKSKYGIYASLGNHETHNKDNKLTFFNNAHITVLQDTIQVIENSFCLVGRNDSRFDNRKSIAELLPGTDCNLPVILLDHRPTEIEQVSKHNVDIQVSGHTHNGQLFPFNFLTGNIYELSWGYKKKRDTHFFVTSGIQAWGPQVKTAGVSEIMVIHVNFISNY